MYPSSFLYGFDWTYGLVLIAFIFSAVVQGKMQATFRRYASIRSSCNMAGAEVARRILDSEGLYDVEVRAVPGSLSDHYDPRSRTVCLSESVYGQRSVASVGVAAHECGHAIQHARAYKPLDLRSALFPVASIGSGISWPLFLIGLFMAARPLILAGIILFSAAVLFQIVTLPVEFNASSRALVKLRELNILSPEEIGGSRRVLKAAAMTYVAAAAASLLQLLRLLILAGARRDD